MFKNPFGQKKQSKEEKAQERKERISQALLNIQSQIIEVQKSKDVAFSKVLEARQKNLPTQEAAARKLLKKTMVIEKKLYNMEIAIQLAIQSSNLASIAKEFADCMEAIAEQVSADTSGLNVKKAKKNHMRIDYATQELDEKVDMMLDSEDGVTTDGGIDEKDSEFDELIDSMVENAESSLGRTYVQTKRKS